MREKIDCFLPCGDLTGTTKTVSQLRASKTVQRIFLLTSSPQTIDGNDALKGCRQLTVDSLTSSNTLMTIAENAKADYVLLQTKAVSVELGEGALERILRVASDSDATMVYADHYDLVDGKRIPHPVIDYQRGSIRDDFDFGSLLLIKTPLLHTCVLMSKLQAVTFALSSPAFGYL